MKKAKLFAKIIYYVFTFSIGIILALFLPFYYMYDSDLLFGSMEKSLAEGNYAEAAKCFNAAGNETAKENLAVLDILNGKYADAAAKLANSDCCGNKALAYILTGQLDKASAAIKCACPASSYLKAVIAARQGNADEVKANLEKAGKDAKLAERAAKDIEFAQYR